MSQVSVCAPSAPASQLIDAYMVQRIEFRARQLAIQLGLSDDRRDDLRQDMALELLKAAADFEPVGDASWRTFAARVLDVTAKRLAQNEYRQRDRQAGTVPYCEPRESDTVAADPGMLDKDDAIGRLERTMDINVVLERMPETLRQTCELLMTHSVSEAAREMGITRSSIYRRIAQAQPYFQRAGMGIGKWDATNSA